MGLFGNRKKREKRQTLDPEALLSVQASRSTVLTAYRDHLDLLRIGVKGARERHEYEYVDILDMEYKRPGDYNGYLKLMVPDEKDLIGKTYFYENFYKSKKKNEIVVTFISRQDVVSGMDQMYRLLVDYVGSARRAARAQAKKDGRLEGNFVLTQAEEQTAAIRKYKELLDDGILTQEEFEQKKKQILEEDV